MFVSVNDHLFLALDRISKKMQYYDGDKQIVVKNAYFMTLCMVEIMAYQFF